MDEPHPPQCGHWGTCPYPLCRCATSSLPLWAFGHFPLTWGIGPLIRRVGPPGGRLTDGHMVPPLRRIQKPHLLSQGPVPNRPDGIRTGSVGLGNSGAEQGPHQPQFLQGQGPVARMEPRKATQILRAGNFAKSSRCASSVTGVWGKAVIGERSLPLRRPPASFGSFSTWKRNSPPGRRNSLKAPQKTLTPPSHLSGSGAGRTGQKTPGYKPRTPAKTAPGPAPSRGCWPASPDTAGSRERRTQAPGR